MKSLPLPRDCDYIGIYLTQKCHLNCDYCLTRHQGGDFLDTPTKGLSGGQWVQGINRLRPPEGIPVTLQGGEPFLYKEISNILEESVHKVDILTALPPGLDRGYFLNLKHLEWNRRKSPYPTIRVSYHKEQHDYRVLVQRIAELQEFLSIGLYYFARPINDEEEVRELKRYADRYHVELRRKEFLGLYRGKWYGNLKYPDAVTGKSRGIRVQCRNTVIPISPSGDIFRCHSDLYHHRSSGRLGNILDEDPQIHGEFHPCDHYGLCNECDVKIKTNHLQKFGYTSVTIRFPPEGEG